MGGFTLIVALMVLFAARDPVRNVVIIDALTLGLCILAVTPLVVALDAQHPEHLSRPHCLGAVGDSLGARGLAVFPTAAGGAVEACGEFLKLLAR